MASIIFSFRKRGFVDLRTLASRVKFFLLIGMMIGGGLLWEIEVVAQQGPSPEKAMRRMDRNKDKQISKTEWNGPARAFEKIDTNADHYLSHDELETWFSKRRARPSGGSPGDATATTLPNQGQMNKDVSNVAWIDTHIHLRRGSGTFSGAARHAIQLMDKSNIQSAILMPQPFPKFGRTRNRYDVRELSKIAKAHPGRFLFLGGGHLINGIIESTPFDQVTDAIREDFTRKANDILDAGARGFGEMGMMHLSHFTGHPSYWVRPDHTLFLLLADIAGKRQAVIDVHMDVVAMAAPTPEHLAGSNPSSMKANLALFERFVAHNRNARIVLAHAGWDVSGQWSAELSRRLLRPHPNLYMSLKISPKGGLLKHALLTKGVSGAINEEWLAVLKEFPDRFVVGSDSFFAELGARGRAPGGMTQFRGPLITSFLGRLPPELARKIAKDNVIAIYGVP